jgi:bile salt-stimulated lipase
MIPAISSFISASHMTSCAVLASSRTATCHTVVSVSCSRPEFLMDRDVIFITFNYRLGILGFLSTEDDVVPGNNGLKDQVMALRWVQNHITSFGGNPDSVTLTGLSAGGSSVHFHYFSEMSKGLFHRGFSQSGVALNSFSLQEDALKKAQRLADAVGCPSTPTQALVDCLKQRHHTQILEKVPLFFGYSFLPFAPFAPVVEKGSKPFLSEHPYSLLTKGKINDVPWISSNTAHEGIFPTMRKTFHSLIPRFNWSTFSL